MKPYILVTIVAALFISTLFAVLAAEFREAFLLPEGEAGFVPFRHSKKNLPAAKTGESGTS